MKSYYQTILIFVSLLTFGGAGCATVTGMIKSLSGEDGEHENVEETDDPIAAAAMRFRQPASDSHGDGTSGGRTWTSRYSSPAADTIGYGMDMGEVSSIWGEPGSIDSAGDPREGNQRWTYYSGLSSRYGLGSKRVVFFESGKVAGWKAAQ